MREKKAFDRAWMKKLLMTQQEDVNKSLRNFSSSSSCLNWHEWTHFSQHGRGKGRASIQAGSNLPWNNTSSKTNPSPLLLQRLQSLERLQFPLAPDENLTSEVSPGYFRFQKGAWTYQSSMNSSQTLCRELAWLLLLDSQYFNCTTWSQTEASDPQL